MGYTNQTFDAQTDKIWALFVCFAVFVGYSMLPDMAAAQSNNAIQTVFCNVVNFFTGATGKALATIAIIVVGVGALMGKVSWGLALIVALGVALIFGAATVVEQLGSPTGANSSCATGLQTIPTGTTR